jgi:hypothetical protein
MRELGGSVVGERVVGRVGKEFVESIAVMIIQLCRFASPA